MRFMPNPRIPEIRNCTPKPQNTHSNQMKGAKGQTSHSRKSTIDTIPKCKVCRKMSKW